MSPWLSYFCSAGALPYGVRPGLYWHCDLGTSYTPDRLPSPSFQDHFWYAGWMGYPGFHIQEGDFQYHKNFIAGA